MDKDYNEISSIIKITTSLLDVFKKVHYWKPLDRFCWDVLDQCFGDDEKVIKRALELYWQAISGLSKISDDSRKGEGDEEELQSFIDTMTEILYYIHYQGPNPILNNYYAHFKVVDEVIECRANELFQSNYITNLPPDKIEYIQRLLNVWAKNDFALKEINNYKIFKSKMEKNGMPLAPAIDYSYLFCFVNDYINSLNIPSRLLKNLLTPGSAEVCSAHKKYWIEYATDKLKNGDVDDIWSDDVVHVVLQLVDVLFCYNDIEEINSLVATIQERRKVFVEKECFSDIRISEALYTMQGIMDTYKDKRITDEETIKKYVEAYKLAFLKELVSGGRKLHNRVSSEYAEFILMQMEAFRELGDNAGINTQLILQRALAEFIVKENDREMNQKFGKDDFPLGIAYLERDKYSYTVYSGGTFVASKPYRISYADLNNSWCPDSLKAIDLVGHEVAHLLNDPLNNDRGYMDYDSYMIYKTRLIVCCFPGAFDSNYSNTYSEIMANIGGMSAQIRALKKFPIDYSVDEKISEINGKIIEKYEEGEKNYLICQDRPKCSLVEKFDELINDKDKYIIAKRLQRLEDILLFEYTEEGIPKSFAEIIKDQEEEMKTGSSKTNGKGPQDMLDRIKFRMRVMIQRAIAKHTEDECMIAINEFIHNHHDELYQYDFFREIFPDGEIPGLLKNEEICNKIMGLQESEYPEGAKEVDYEKVGFVHALYTLRREKYRRLWLLEDRPSIRDGLNSDIMTYSRRRIMYDMGIWDISRKPIFTCGIEESELDELEEELEEELPK